MDERGFKLNLANVTRLNPGQLNEKLIDLDLALKYINPHNIYFKER
ncbi:hypothetical protein [Bacillus sp. FJAT-18017]|nr:hypothetical protein [Bacillus sp. FJAT-18017]